MSLEVDLMNISNGNLQETNFGSQLLRLIFKADQHNKQLLQMGFPNAVAMVYRYQMHGDILDLPYD